MRYQLTLNFLIFTLLAQPMPAAAEIPKLSEVDPGAVYRGAQPTELADYQRLRDEFGVRTIINLRKDETVEQERVTVEALGMKFMSFPMTAMSYPSKKKMNRIYAAMTNPDLQPVFIHCKAGKDRTGLAVGLYRVKKQNWDRHDAYQEMLSFGFNRWYIGLLAYFWLHTH